MLLCQPGVYNGSMGWPDTDYALLLPVGLLPAYALKSKELYFDQCLLHTARLGSSAQHMLLCQPGVYDGSIGWPDTDYAARTAFPSRAPSNTSSEKLRMVFWSNVWSTRLTDRISGSTHVTMQGVQGVQHKSMFCADKDYTVGIAFAGLATSNTSSENLRMDFLPMSGLAQNSIFFCQSLHRN